MLKCFHEFGPIDRNPRREGLPEGPSSSKNKSDRKLESKNLKDEKIEEEQKKLKKEKRNEEEKKDDKKNEKYCNSIETMSTKTELTLKVKNLWDKLFDSHSSIAKYTKNTKFEEARTLLEKQVADYLNYRVDLCDKEQVRKFTKEFDDYASTFEEFMNWWAVLYERGGGEGGRSLIVNLEKVPRAAEAYVKLAPFGSKQVIITYQDRIGLQYAGGGNFKRIGNFTPCNKDSSPILEDGNSTRDARQILKNMIRDTISGYDFPSFWRWEDENKDKFANDLVKAIYDTYPKPDRAINLTAKNLIHIVSALQSHLETIYNSPDSSIDEKKQKLVISNVLNAVAEMKKN